MSSFKIYDAQPAMTQANARSKELPLIIRPSMHHPIPHLDENGFGAFADKATNGHTFPMLLRY